MINKPDNRYEEALEWIHGLGRFGIKPGLERVKALLEMTGNPHIRNRYVHIAGTNGKGSTAAMLAAILRSAGYRVGLYTSPYLLSFTNRMAVNGNDIEPDELVGLVDRIKPLIEIIKNDPDLGQPTEFEVVTVLALNYFAQENTDLVVLEVGLGGRLDATNVIDPLLSVITNISLEHTAILGDTIEAIAGEKAGIIKEKRPLLTASTDQTALDVFKKRCLELDSPFFRVYPPVSKELAAGGLKPCTISGDIIDRGQYFAYRGFQKDLESLFIPLRGTYQLENAGTALAALELLSDAGFTVREDEIRRGLEKVTWPGRLELLALKPLLIMDGAHNPGAAVKLAEAVPLYFKYKKLILLYGMLADKDMAPMLKSILPLADEIVFTKPELPRAAEPDLLYEFAVDKLGIRKPVYIEENYGKAFELAISLATPEDAVLVTGSLYTVSDVRHYWAHKWQ